MPKKKMKQSKKDELDVTNLPKKLHEIENSHYVG